MPRIANETSAMLADIQRRLARLVETATKEGRDNALSEVRSLLGGSAAVAGRGGRRAKSVAGKRGRKKGARKAAKKSGRKKRKTWWDTATKAQKAERVRKMQAGRGLKPKAKKKKK